MKRAWIVWLIFIFGWGTMVGGYGWFGGGGTAAAHNGSESPPASSSPSPGHNDAGSGSSMDAAAVPASKTQAIDAPQLQVTSGGTAAVQGEDAGFRLGPLFVLDARTAWVVRTVAGEVDAIDATEDGGTTWSERARMGGLHVLALHAASTKIGWLVASTGCKVQDGTNRCSQLQIMRTQDGGRSWAAQLKWNSAIQETEIEAKDARRVAILAGGKLYRSEDGGLRWNELKLGIEGYVPQRISFPTAEQGWASGSLCGEKQADGSVSCRIAIVRTSDGGAHWKQLPQPQEKPSGLMSSLIRFIDDKHGWLLSADYDTMLAKLYATVDGGQHWEQRQELKSGRPTPAGLEFVTAADGWIPLNTGAGPIEGGMMATHDGGRHWDTVRGGSFEQGTALSANEIWGVEQSRTIVRTTDGGKTWRQLYPQPAPQHDIAFVDGLSGFGLGIPSDPNALLATADGGKTWRPLPGSGITGSVRAISFANRQTGWALEQLSGGNAWQVMQTKDGGSEWQALAPIAIKDASGRPYFHFFSEQDGVAATVNGRTQTVFRTKDGGRTWTEASSAYVQAGGGDLFGFSTPARGWTYRDAKPEQGAVLYRTEDGGSWQPFGVLPKQSWAFALHFASDQQGWVLQQRDPFLTDSSWSLLATADGGATWRETAFPAKLRLDERTLKLQFVDGKHGWLLSGAGLLRTEDGGATWSW